MVKEVTRGGVVSATAAALVSSGAAGPEQLLDLRRQQVARVPQPVHDDELDPPEAGHAPSAQGATALVLPVHVGPRHPVEHRPWYCRSGGRLQVEAAGPLRVAHQLVDAGLVVGEAHAHRDRLVAAVGVDLAGSDAEGGDRRRGGVRRERRVGETRAAGAEASLEILPVELDEILDLIVDAQVRDPPEPRSAARRQDQRPLVVTLERASGDAVHVGEGGLRPGGRSEVDLDEPHADLVVGEVHPDGEGLVRCRGVDDGGGQGERGDLRRVRVVGARRSRQRRRAEQNRQPEQRDDEDPCRGPPHPAPAHAAPPRSGGAVSR